ncbi:hypothetical protein MIND_01397800 [Mycena indigotica]|uniref:F-box domain-containing protein n=1 Tax=Mycena indigotica TaxID=2126181 RepID=A0A8H6RX20_9AGAR|nr:uncharacterized protein MIND_01397800 [Mycena indigotica]KAF7289355.1 hypothetical protein MIND_01397800 [Mycena indigotica]
MSPNPKVPQRCPTTGSKYTGFDLPTELVLSIAGFASRQSLGRLCCVSRRLCSILVYPLYETILHLDERQSVLLACTLRTAKPPNWRPHPAEIIKTVTFTDDEGTTANGWDVSNATKALENLVRCVPGGTGSPLRTLHWSVCSFMDRLGPLLMAPGNFPNLKELFVISNGTNRNFMFMHKGGLETFSLELSIDLSDEDEACLLYKLGESMQMLPITSPDLRSLRIKLDMWFEDLPFHGCSEFTNSFNHVRFPVLEKLDLSVSFRADYGFVGGDEDEEEMDFMPFLTAHPTVVDLSLWAMGTEPLENIPMFSNLRSFKGVPADLTLLLLLKPQQLNSIFITLVHRTDYEAPSFYIPLLDTHMGITRLTIEASKADGSILKSPDEVSPTTLAALASSFPNLEHLDIPLTEPMAQYVKALKSLKKLETIRLHEYRRKKITSKRLLAKAFPHTKYVQPILNQLVPFLPQLTSVEICILADDRGPGREVRCTCGQCESFDEDEDESEFMLQPAEIEIEYHFQIARPKDGEAKVVLERSAFIDARPATMFFNALAAML